MKAELFLEMKCELGECPVWDEKNQRLYWVDIADRKLYWYDLEHDESKVNGVQSAEDITGKIQSVGFHSELGNAILMDDDRLLLAIADALYIYDPSDDSLKMMESTHIGKVTSRYNDGKCDPRGWVFIGTMDRQEKRFGEHLYRIDSEGQMTAVLDEVSISNGLCWNVSGDKFYYIDTPTREIAQFDYDLVTGNISERVVVGTIEKGDGWPDGMTIDAKGNLWVAHWAGQKISIWNPEDGVRIGEVFIPAVNVTSATFGGPDLDELYVTTARIGVSEEDLEKYPLTGSVFRVKADVKGYVADRYRTH